MTNTSSYRPKWHRAKLRSPSSVARRNGHIIWLWRAVDQDGCVLDEIVQARRNSKAAKRLLIRLMKKQGCLPKRTVTDKLASYGAARRQIMPTVEHRSHKGLNTELKTHICRCGNGSG
jgi:transposase-like protein